MSERTHLRDRVFGAIRATDDVFRRIADAVRGLGNLFRAPWNRRVRRQVRELVDGMLNRGIGLTVRAAMVSELYNVLSQHVSLTRLGVFERAGITPDLVQAPAKLAKWLARAGREASRVVRKTINRGGEVAEVVNVLDPAKAPLSFKPNGQVVVQPGGESPHGANRARTAARTVIAEEHTASVVEVAKQTGGNVRYVLSALHPKVDQCDPLADKDVHGLGVGVYPVSKCPKPPVHINCLCSLEPVA